MARPLRVEYPGAIYHITSRDNATSPFFKDGRDRRQFPLILEIEKLKPALKERSKIKEVPKDQLTDQ